MRSQMGTWGAFGEHSGSIRGTFGEHSGNIQGTFREHSGNIQGTFMVREHAGHFEGTFTNNSVRVEVDAREPPSQLQEALKESTKVDAEYNLPTWVPKTRVDMTN
jgi:hypothetical protein